jgi:putative transposase
VKTRLSVDQLQRVTSWSERTVRAKAESGELLWCIDDNYTGRGRKPRLYFADSPALETFQLDIAKLQLAAAAEESLSLQTADLGNSGAGTSSQSAAPDGQGRLFKQSAAGPAVRINLTPEQQQQAAQRLAMIEPLIDWRAGKKRTIALPGGRYVETAEQLVQWLAEQHQVSARTLWNWDKRWREGGEGALADTDRADKGKSKFFRKHPLAAEFIKSKFLSEGRISKEAAFFALKREWSRLYNHGSKAPSYETVRAFIEAEIPEPVKILAREGERAYEERCAPYVLRDPGRMAPNDWWVSDHMIHDVWVMNDNFFPGIAPWYPLRPWVTLFMDMRTRLVTGAAWCANPSSESISSALRVGMSYAGIPLNLYVDNGKDYKKVAKLSADKSKPRPDLSPAARGVLAMLNIKVTHALPFHPQSKPVESWFGNRLHEGFDKIFGPFYAGNKPANRPEACSEMLAIHKAWMQKKAPETFLPKASEFVRMAVDYIDEYNREFPHSGRAMNHRAPLTVFNELLPPAQRRIPENPAALVPLFWDKQQRVVREGGCVEMYNQRYRPAGPEDKATLFMLIERKVHVAADPLNIGQAIVLNDAGYPVARLVVQELLGHDPVSLEAVRVSMKERRRAKRAIEQYVQGLSRAARGRGDLTELEHRRQRVGLPVAAGGEMFHEEQFSDDQVSPGTGGQAFAGRRALAAAVGSDLAPHVDDVVDQFFADVDDEKDGSHGD